MLGYGPYHYTYPSGREGDAAIITLASQKNHISLYVMCDQGVLQRFVAQGRGDSLGNSRAVDQAQRMAQRQAAGAFALTGRLPLRPSKQGKEIISCHLAVRNLRCSHPHGHSRKMLLGPCRGRDRIRDPHATVVDHKQAVAGVCCVSAPVWWPNGACAGAVTVTAQDAFLNTVTGYTGTVHFTSTDGSAVPPPDTTLTAGAGIFNATFTTPSSTNPCNWPLSTRTTGGVCCAAVPTPIAATAEPVVAAVGA